MTATRLRGVHRLSLDIPEPIWGEVFARIRRSHYSNGAELVLDLESIGVDTSTATISRLESATTAPTEEKRLVVAVAALALCDTHPERLGLSLDVLPRRVYDAIFGITTTPDGLEISPSGCNGGRVLAFRARDMAPSRRAA